MNELSKSMRASVLETLKLIASEETQRGYQREAPHVNVPSELFNQWDDFYFPENDDFRAGFAAAELEVLAKFAEVLDRVSDETPQDLPALEQFLLTDAWRRLSAAARDALSALGA